MTEPPTTRPKLSPVTQRIAAELGETAPGPLAQLDRIVRRLGEERAYLLLEQAMAIEERGGVLLPDGSRRHTPGGVFFRLAREQVTPELRAKLFPPLPKRKRKGATPPAAADGGHPA
jgi:hypothetical protein